MFEVTATVKPGVDPALVEKRLDEIVADFIANGPTEDEVRRAATREVAGPDPRARAGRRLRRQGGRAGRGPGLCRRLRLLQEARSTNMPRATPGRNPRGDAAMADAARRSPSGSSRATARPMTRPRPRPKPRRRPTSRRRSSSAPIPPIGAQIRARLPDDRACPTCRTASSSLTPSATAVPITQLALSFDAGFAADAPDARGLQNLTLSLLDEGADGMTSQQIAEAQERLGARSAPAASADRSTVVLSALSANLAPSLDLLADIVQRPTFAAAEVDRVRAQTLTAIAQAQKDPGAIASRGAAGIAVRREPSLCDDRRSAMPAAVNALHPRRLVGFQQRWLRPDNLEIFVVSNLPLAEVQPLARAALRDAGRRRRVPEGREERSPRRRRGRPSERIVLVDRPGSPQSVIYGGQITPIDPRGEIAPISSANDVLGGNFLSRINMDLRETKGWSYGVQRHPSQLNANARALHRQRAGAGRPHRRIRSWRCRSRFRASSGPRASTEEELSRTDHQLYPDGCRGSSRLRARC